MIGSCLSPSSTLLSRTQSGDAYEVDPRAGGAAVVPIDQTGARSAHNDPNSRIMIGEMSWCGLSRFFVLALEPTMDVLHFWAQLSIKGNKVQATSRLSI